MNSAAPPTLGQALFSAAVFIVLGAFFMSLLNDESVQGNSILGIILACLMFAMAGWRTTYVVRAIRARRTRRQ
ncbi:hypothetical protein [Nocardioides limicola]|uniref:hypothetical protein n=1 Tax=Nocardioides limicola TaxID=2803368 RepID=UPI00193B5CC7|nr:hypothetical protein [Nocardioides sp. DJM-14]